MRTGQPLRVGDDAGIALIAVLLAMVLLTAIGTALAAVGIVEYRTSVNHRSATRALLLADAGATHALALLRGPLADRSYTQLLIGPDGVANTPDDGLLSDIGLEIEAEVPDTGVQLGQGRYFVRLINDPLDPSGTPYVDGNYRLVALCRGEMVDGGMAEVRAVLAAPSYPAIATNGDLDVPGTPDVLGPCAGVHANKKLKINGRPVVDGRVSASDTVIVAGKIEDSWGNSVEAGYEPPIEIPEYDPMEFCDQADYMLANGWVVSFGPPRDSAKAGGPGSMGWHWDASDNTYTLKADKAQPGSACVQGNVKVTGNLGSAGSPFDMSLFASGSVRMGGTPVIQADHVDGLLIVAGGDVLIGGNPAATDAYYRGTVYAGSQCQVNGTPVVDGNILCYDAPDPDGAVNLVGTNRVNGNPRFTYDCSGLRRIALMSAWWELRTQ